MAECVVDKTLSTSCVILLCEGKPAETTGSKPAHMQHAQVRVPRVWASLLARKVITFHLVVRKEFVVQSFILTFRYASFGNTGISKISYR